VEKWQYYTLLARALPGTPLHSLKWHISRVEGWCAIHGAGILDGNTYMWPDPRLSQSGRRMLRIRDLRESFQNGDWQPFIDL
jgi:hypothetical protein